MAKSDDHLPAPQPREEDDAVHEPHAQSVMNCFPSLSISALRLLTATCLALWACCSRSYSSAGPAARFLWSSPDCGGFLCPTYCGHLGAVQEAAAGCGSTTCTFQRGGWGSACPHKHEVILCLSICRFVLWIPQNSPVCPYSQATLFAYASTSISVCLRLLLSVHPPPPPLSLSRSSSATPSGTAYCPADYL